MKQLEFEFLKEESRELEVSLEPKLEAELVALMSAAIAKLYREEGRRDDLQSTDQQDQT